MQAADVAPPPELTAQGRLSEHGFPVTGTRVFTFSILQNGSALWTSPGLNLNVVDGLYAVLLGDTTGAGMTTIHTGVLNQSGLHLHIQVGSTALTPDIAIVPALQAQFAFSVASGAVGTDQLKDGSVTAAKLAPGTITAITSLAWFLPSPARLPTLSGFAITDAVHLGSGGPGTISAGTAAPSGGVTGDLYVKTDTPANLSAVKVGLPGSPSPGGATGPYRVPARSSRPGWRRWSDRTCWCSWSDRPGWCPQVPLAYKAWQEPLVQLARPGVSVRPARQAPLVPLAYWKVWQDFRRCGWPSTGAVGQTGPVGATGAQVGIAGPAAEVQWVRPGLRVQLVPRAQLVLPVQSGRPVPLVLRVSRD